MNDEIRKIIEPPEGLDGEAFLEWERICTELHSQGKLNPNHRAILTLYVETWAINRAAAKRVATYGAVIILPNQIATQSPFYKVARETSLQLRTLLNDLGLTPASQTTGSDAKEPEDLEV